MLSVKNMRSTFNGLCKPSQIYLAISLGSILFTVLQNMMNGDSKLFCMGIHECELAFSKWLTFIPQLIYVAVWTIILNSLCKTGYERLSWFFVLLPFVFMFLLLALFMLSNM